jgi:chromosome segregation ATPase
MDSNPDNSLLVIQPKAPTDQQIIDQLRADRDKNWNLYQDQLKQTQQAQDQLKASQDEVTSLTGEVNDYKTKYQSEQQTNIGLNSDIQSLSGTIESIKAEDKQYAQEALDAQKALTALQARFNNILKALGLSQTATDEEINLTIQNLPSKKIVEVKTPSIITWIIALLKKQL